QLLSLSEHVRQERRNLLDPDAQTGELTELAERHAQLSSELQTFENSQRPYRELWQKRKKLEGDIENLQERQSGIQEQMRGHLFLQRVWGPWNRVRECETELAEIPIVNAFPEKGIERLDQLEKSLNASAAARDKILAEAKQHRQSIAKLKPDPEVQPHL